MRVYRKSPQPRKGAPLLMIAPPNWCSLESESFTLPQPSRGSTSHLLEGCSFWVLYAWSWWKSAMESWIGLHKHSTPCSISQLQYVHYVRSQLKDQDYKGSRLDMYLYTAHPNPKEGNRRDQPASSQI
ncbi:hypothetical protein N7510_007034 [Penicillium lagena]|uniref:uncharacterized protein n=1 Tax=Penicillium lagena TaxID=94218 RepID=UPI00253F6BCC|nr:uncharacterized protein N7510_007034 [Penicillium lagena]KAJ5610315.1 hypothetical protein N7510_007034 [Penicillium lagena]